MNKDKYSVIVKSINDVRKGDYNPDSLFKMTSITKENAAINPITGMPSEMARLYLHSNMRGVIGSIVGRDLAEKFFNDDGYIDIIVADLRISLREKVQLHSLWGDNYFALYHGLEAPTISLAGFMYNARNNDWWDDFINVYLSILRGSELAKYEQVVCLNYYTYNNIFFSITNFDSGVNATSQSQIQFALNGVVHKISIKSSNYNRPEGSPEKSRYETVNEIFPVAPERFVSVSQFKYDQYYYSSDLNGNNVDSGKNFSIKLEELK
ncbi:MAG: hypothetical protein QXQ43_00610 [Nitrososphaerota archaeon]